MLERASLEESDDEALTTAWAALIASASLEYDAEVTTFSRILSELSPRECLILQRVFGGRWDWVSGTRPPGAMTRFFESEAEIKPMLRQAVVKEDKSVFSKLQNYVDPAFPMEFTRALTRGTSQRANWIDKVLKEPSTQKMSLVIHCSKRRDLLSAVAKVIHGMLEKPPLGLTG